MSELIYLIHGFNVEDEGEGTINSIKPLLEAKGYTVRSINYGHFHRVRVRLCNKGIAQAISTIVKPGSTCIGHSNGCALAYLACEFGAPFKNVVLVNPALDSELAINNRVENVRVWYSPTDTAVTWAEYIPYSIWGAQGRTGYKGKKDERYYHYNEDLLLGGNIGHSGIWKKGDYRKYFVDKTDELIKGA